MTATIYPGDCLDVMQDLPAESVDIIVTSPPYNIGVVYDEYGDKMTGENYLEYWNRTVSGLRGDRRKPLAFNLIRRIKVARF
jgi:site-specific DNA-methyltransferase (adenine-specific)